MFMSLTAWSLISQYSYGAATTNVEHCWNFHKRDPIPSQHSQATGFLLKEFWKKSLPMKICSVKDTRKDSHMETVKLWVRTLDPMHPQIAKILGPTWGPLGPVGPRWAPCRPHEPCYQGQWSCIKSRMNIFYYNILSYSIPRTITHR